MNTILNKFNHNINIKVKTEKVKTEKVKTEKVKTEKVKTEKVKTEKVKTEKVKTEKIKTEKIKTEKINKGIGAGGKKTNESGKTYEQKIDCTNYLISNGFEFLQNTYLSKTINNLEILFFQQRELNKYLDKKFNKQIYRIPDQSILIISKEKKPKLIIIEIKNQNVPGSVDEKLWAGIAIKKNYQYWLEEFEIEYVFILSTFLFNLVIENKKKYNGLKILFEFDNILVFNGDDINNNENIYNIIINNS